MEAKNSHEITSAKIALNQRFKLSIGGVGSDRDTQRLEAQELIPMSEKSGHITLLFVSTSFLACQQNNIHINYICRFLHQSLMCPSTPANLIPFSANPSVHVIPGRQYSSSLYMLLQLWCCLCPIFCDVS